MQCFLSRYVKGVPYSNRRCTKWYLYVKITYERVRGWTSRWNTRVLSKHEKINKRSHESIKPQLKYCSPCKGRENERYFCLCLWLPGCYDISLIFIRAETEVRLQLFTNLIEVPFFLSICCIGRQNKRVKKKTLQSCKILRKLFVSLAIWLSSPFPPKYNPITIIQ